MDLGDSQQENIEVSGRILADVRQQRIMKLTDELFKANTELDIKTALVEQLINENQSLRDLNEILKVNQIQPNSA